MAGHARAGLLTGSWGTAALVGFDGWQFFTDWLFGGLTGAVGPLLGGGGGVAMVGPTVGVTARLLGPLRGWLDLTYAMGGSSATGRLSTMLVPEIGLGWSLGNSSRIGLGVSGWFGDNGRDQGLMVSLVFGTRHAIAYAQDPTY